MSKAKRKRVKRKQGKRKGNRKEASNVNKGQLRVSILVLLFLLSIIGYVVYTAILITGIEKNDPLEENGSSAYLLSSTSSDDLDKTLWIFEEGEGDDKKITEAFLVASNREKNFLLNIYIPGWIRFSLAEEEFGNALTVSNFRYAGEFLNEGRGIEYAIWQFEQMLGTKIDSYIWIGKREQSLYSEVFGYYKDPKGTYGYDFSKEDFAQNTLLLDNFVSEYSFLGIILHPQKVSGIGDGIISNRSFTDVLGKIISTRKELRRSEKYIIDLGNTKYIDEELSNAGGLSYYLNSSKYDGVLREYFLNILDRELEKERVRVEVYNGSGISGAASQMARRIENSGCDIVRYENAPDFLEHTVLYIPDEERFKNSVAIVKEVVGTNVEVLNSRPQFMTTGDIVVVLGRDIERIYSF